MHYFAYGSNISIRRLQSRCSHARAVGVYRLEAHRLLFNMQSRDGSGKGNIEPSTGTQDVVYGTVFDIPTQQIQALDHAESLGVGYRKEVIEVVDNSDNKLDAFVYIALRTQNDLKPYHWYLTHLLNGATQAQFPPFYLQFLQQFRCIKDQDSERENRELSIYLP